jgi:hypothetical protein
MELNPIHTRLLRTCLMAVIASAKKMRGTG